MRPPIEHRRDPDAWRLTTLVLVIVLGASLNAFAQDESPPRRPPSPPLPPPTLEIGGYAMLGLMTFTAADTFDTGLGSSYGNIFGGGVRVGLPLGGLFVNVGAWRFRDRGERVFVFEGRKFPLGIPLHVTITPVEISGGWQFRLRRAPQVRPYVAGGFTSYGYSETSEFAAADDNVDERFGGYHLAGGVAFPVQRWLGVAWEVNWTRVPGAIGDAGLSAAFAESDLGGGSFRFKITIGR
jgi:hypothetical protein